MRISVDLPNASHEALGDLAIDERRDARDQAAVLIIRSLARRGLVTPDGLARRDAQDDRSSADAA